MSKLKALIFDVDGTLADTEKGHLKAFNIAFKNAGLDWEWSIELYNDLLTVTGGKERIKYYLGKYNPEFTIDGDPDEFIRKLHADKTIAYVDLLDNGGLSLRTGVEALFNEARDANLRLAIATTTTPENVTALIKNTLGESALDWFEVIGAGSVVPHKKPASDIYDYVLEKMSLSADECMAFEDSENGVISARDANLPVIVTTNDFTLEHDFSGAILVVDSMGSKEQPFKVTYGEVEGETFLNLKVIQHNFELAHQ